MKRIYDREKLFSGVALCADAYYENVDAIWLFLSSPDWEGHYDIRYGDEAKCVSILFDADEVAMVFALNFAEFLA